MGGKGFFGNTFDFNGDGQLDAFEQAVDFGMFMQVMESEKNDSDELPKSDPDNFD